MSLIFCRRILIENRFLPYFLFSTYFFAAVMSQIFSPKTHFHKQFVAAMSHIFICITKNLRQRCLKIFCTHSIFSQYLIKELIFFIPNFDPIMAAALSLIFLRTLKLVPQNFFQKSIVHLIVPIQARILFESKINFSTFFHPIYFVSHTFATVICVTHL